jgi:hypothetical protein
MQFKFSLLKSESLLFFSTLSFVQSTCKCKSFLHKNNTPQSYTLKSKSFSVKACEMKGIIIILLFFRCLLYSQGLDIETLREINLERNQKWDNAFKGITNSAAPVSIGVPIILLGMDLLMKRSDNTNNAYYIGTAVFTSAVISTIFKYSVDRPRPIETYPDIQKRTSGGSPSFPSGHTSDAFALATSLSLAYPKWYIIAPSFIWAGAVGYSRMDLGVHYPSDVLFGAIAGAGSAYLCYVINKSINHKRERRLQPR